MKEWPGVVAVAVSSILFGTLAIFGKYAQQEHVTIATLLSLRFLIAASVLSAILVVGHQLHWPGWKRVLHLLVLGMLFLGQSAAYFISLRNTPAAVTSVLLYIYPVVVAVLGWLAFRERVSARGLAALGLASIGVILVTGITTGGGTVGASGVLWGMAAGVLYAVYIVMGKRVLGGLTPLFTMAAVTATAAVGFLGYGAVTGTLRGFAPLGWLSVLGSALLPTVVGATLFLFGLARIGAAPASVLSTLEPVATGGLAAVLLAESLSVTRLIGGGAVLAAAALVATEGRRPARAVAVGSS